MSRRIHRFIRLFAATLFLTACNMPFESQGPRTWIDQPLDEDQVPLTALTIQAHASDEDGVAGIQFFVSDVLIQEVSTGGNRLGDASIEWTPSNPGNYIILAQAVDNQGNLGSPTSVQIVVGGAGLATETPTPAPALQQCLSESLIAPVLLSPVDGSMISSDPLLAWSYPDTTCHPHSYRIDISEDSSFSDTGWGFGTSDYNETSRQWPLPADKCYYWRVMAYVPDVNGPASDPWSFCIAEATGPTFTLDQNANCRFGPGTAYEADDTLLQGETVIIEGRNAENTWLFVRKLGDSSPCWVSVITGQIAGNLESVQVVEVAPLTESPTESSGDETPPDIANIFVDSSPIQVDGCGGPSTTLVGADVSDAGGMSRVVARIPGYGEVELTLFGADHYEATLGPFDEIGDYSIIFQAWDNAGNGAQAGPVILSVACVE